MHKYCRECAVRKERLLWGKNKVWRRTKCMCVCMCCTSSFTWLLFHVYIWLWEYVCVEEGVEGEHLGYVRWQYQRGKKCMKEGQKCTKGWKERRCADVCECVLSVHMYCTSNSSMGSCPVTVWEWRGYFGFPSLGFGGHIHKPLTHTQCMTSLAGHLT